MTPRTTLGCALVKAGLLRIEPAPSPTPSVRRRPGRTAAPVPPVVATTRPYFRDDLPVPPDPPPFEPPPKYRAAELRSAPLGHEPPRSRPAPETGPARVTGEMVWLHKTAPVLEISGRRSLTPDDYAAGRRR